MRALAIGMVAALVFGCGVHAGKVTPDECTGVYVSLGDTTGPCGLDGGTISLPGATVVGGIFQAAGDAAMALLGRAPIQIEHVDASSRPIEAD